MDGISLTSGGLRDDLRGMIEQKGEKLESPQHIIQSVSSARALYSQVRQQNLKRIAQWAAIEGLIEGNQPYDQADLDKHGLSYMANFNDLSAGARFEKEVLAYFNLIHQAELLVNFSLDLSLLSDDEDIVEIAEAESGRWAQIMSIEATKILRKWPSFFTMLGTHIAQLSKFGLSAVLWSDERDWRPRTVELHRIALPDQVESDIDQLTFIFLENDFTAQYLFNVYQDLSAKGAALDDPEDYKHFWNLKTLGDLLLARANTYAKPNNTQFIDFFQLQQALQNGDYTWNELYGDGIKLQTLLYKEYDEKITHYMFDTVSDSGGGFVFLADRQYDTFWEAVQIFTVSPGKFKLHSNRGIGHKVFAPCQAKNQLACSTVDMARHASTPMLRNEGGSIKEPQQLKMFPGVPTDIGAAEFVQNNLGNNLPQVISVLQYMDQNLSINLGMSGDDPAIPEGSNASVGSAQARLQRAPRASLLKHHTAHFLMQLDYFYQNIFSKMIRAKEGFPGAKLALLWKKKCVKKGVPEQIFEIPDDVSGLPDWIDVTATRVGGDGSMEGLLLGITDLETIAPMMGPRELSAFKRDKVLATLGPDAISRYTQDTDKEDEISSGASDANLENAVMQLGFPALFSKTNDHISHFGVHMSLNISIIQNIQQQKMTPVEGNKILEMSVPHTGEHWAALVARGNFGKAFVDKWRDSYEQVTKYYELNRKNAIKMKEAEIRKEQERQAQQQEAMSDAERKDFIAQSDERRKDWQTQKKEERQEKESQTRADLKRREIENKASTDRLKISLDRDNESRELQADREELAALTEIETPEPVLGEV